MCWILASLLATFFLSWDLCQLKSWTDMLQSGCLVEGLGYLSPFPPPKSTDLLYHWLQQVPIWCCYTSRLWVVERIELCCMFGSRLSLVQEKKRKIIYLYRKGSCFQYSWLYVSSCLLLVIFSNWGVAGITHAFEAVTLTGADYSIISLCETNFPKLWYLSMVLYIGSALRKQIYKFVLCLRSQRHQWNIASALQFHCMLNK